MEPNEKNQNNINVFIKLGVLILSIILIVNIGMQVLPGAITVTSTGSKKDLPIFSVNTKEKKVSLSFDVAWGNEDTNAILDILNKHDIKATFFITGEWVKQYPKNVKAIVANGHDLANHSEDHKSMVKLSKKQCKDEIMKVHQQVKELTGIDMNLFRAPYGDYDNTVLGTARECGYYTIQWDVDTYDWKDYTAECIINRTVTNPTLTNGSIILMNDGAKNTVEALDGIITGLQKQGYKIVPVSKLIYKKNYMVDPSGRQFER